MRNIISCKFFKLKSLIGENLKNFTSEMLQQQTGKISKLKTFVVITFSVSLIAVIIEILNIVLKYF